MKDHTAFSPDALRVLTRLGRQLHKLDGYRIAMSDKFAVLQLIENAAWDPRPEVHTIAEELIQSPKPEELAYLRNHDLDLAGLAPTKSKTGSASRTNAAQRIYRGQVITDEATARDASNRSDYDQTDPPRRHRRVYRGQVIEE